MIANTMQWDINHVTDVLQVRLYSTARVKHASGQTRNYWATESQYPYNKGVRQDMVEIDVGGGNIGVAQLVAFINLTDLPSHCTTLSRHCLLIRWLSVSRRSHSRDDQGRPLCGYPLCNNHCLWQWSVVQKRACLTRRGAIKKITRQRIYNRFPHRDRKDIIRKEVNARYDIIDFKSIKRHANITLPVDPSTGHMLQTIQII